MKNTKEWTTIPTEEYNQMKEKISELDKIIYGENAIECRYFHTYGIVGACYEWRFIYADEAQMHLLASFEQIKKEFAEYKNRKKWYQFWKK